ncbi:trypsin domain-containing protein [Ditylenchus destructor]|nr:trypsin domain-containing protein [Ditylenchus destructor]
MSQITDRIGGGGPSPLGQFKFTAALLTDSPDNKLSLQCSAVLITPRHLITTRHCLRGEISEGEKHHVYSLWMGGICNTKSEKCSEGSGMTQVEYDFAIMNGGTLENLNYLEFAIIQLNESVFDGALRERVEIACMPQHNKPVPSKLTLVGWSSEDAAEGTIVQHNITLPMESPCLESDDIICINAPDSEKVGAIHADTGTGGVTYSELIGNYIVYGIVSNGVVISNDTGNRISTLLKTGYFLNDLCFYLGLCTSDSVRDNLNTLIPKLNFDSVYLPLKTRASLDKDVGPFRQISQESAAILTKKCANVRTTVHNDGNTEFCSIQNDWALAIVHPESKSELLCDAILVTDQHAITIRDCIIPHMKGMRPHNVRLSVMERKCLQGLTQCRSWTVNMIAWSYSYPLVVVQLSARDKLSLSPPCMEFASSSKSESAYRAYDTIYTVENFTTTNPNKEYLCKHEDLLCAKPLDNCNSDQGNGVIPSAGSGIFDAKSGKLEGMKMLKVASFKDNSVETYWRMHRLMDTLCIYLSRCDKYEYTFFPNIPYFSRFYDLDENIFNKK